MKEIMMKLLLELIMDSKRSDREIAKALDVSQATVSRTRNSLLEKGIIKEFTVIPDFVELGYELMVITMGKYKVLRTEESLKKMLEWINKHHNIIFGSRVQGMGKDGILISLHRNYTEYDQFLANLKAELGDYVENTENVLISLKGYVAKPFSLRSLSRDQLREKKQD
jgi:DNA-binding Lrp family transcriptional regulator